MARGQRKSSAKRSIQLEYVVLSQDAVRAVRSFTRAHERSMRDVAKSVEASTDSWAQLAEKITGVGSAIELAGKAWDFAVESYQLSNQAARDVANLNRALEIHGIAARDAAAGVEAFTQSLARQFAITDHEAVAVFEQFARHTQDLNLSMEELQEGVELAMSLAVSTGEPALEMARDLSEVYAGEVQVLEQLNRSYIGLADSLMELENPADRVQPALNRLREDLEGASDVIRDQERRVSSLKNSWDELRIAVGDAALELTDWNADARRMVDLIEQGGFTDRSAIIRHFEALGVNAAAAASAVSAVEFQLRNYQAALGMVPEFEEPGFEPLGPGDYRVPTLEELMAGTGEEGAAPTPVSAPGGPVLPEGVKEEPDKRGPFAAFFGFIQESWKRGALGTLQFLAEAQAEFTGDIDKVLDPDKPPPKGVVTPHKKGMGEGAGPFATFFEDLGTGVVDTLAGASDAFGDFFTGIIAGGENAADSVKGLFANLMSQFASAMSAAASASAAASSFGPWGLFTAIAVGASVAAGMLGGGGTSGSTSTTTVQAAETITGFAPQLGPGQAINLEQSVGASFGPSRAQQRRRSQRLLADGVRLGEVGFR